MTINSMRSKNLVNSKATKGAKATNGLSLARPYLSRLLVLALLVGIAVVSGCTYFDKKGEPPPNVGFRPIAAATSNIVPVPVEIARDIQRISSGEAYNNTPEIPTEIAATPGATDAAIAAGLVPTGVPTALPNKNDQSNIADSRNPSGVKGGKSETYKVKFGDTLMKIAFEKYGNLYRWREIYDANRDKVRAFNFLTIGSVLQIHGVDYVVINHNGKPYLIKRNDTLLKISGLLYGTSDYWQELWHNNRQLIHDPNQIYYGFTLYYQDQNQFGKIKETRIPATKK